MAEEITSLKLKIDVQSVDEANKKLDDWNGNTFSNKKIKG